MRNECEDECRDSGDEYERITIMNTNMNPKVRVLNTKVPCPECRLDEMNAN